MGLLDSMTSAMNRGADSMNRTTEKARLKSHISELNKQRQNLAAQLGASLYDITKTDPNLRIGREGLYDAIAACDAEREQCQMRINEIESANQAAASAAASFRCAVCGAPMMGADLFCSGCGAPAEQARPQNMNPAPVAAAKNCPSCGAPMAADDVFCMTCGTKVEGNAQTVTSNVVVEEIDVTMNNGGVQ